MKDVSSSNQIGTNRQKIKGTRADQVYVGGSAARKLQTVPIRREKQQARPAKRPVKRQQIRTSYMNFAYIVFMAAAMLVVCAVLIGYINLQADITNRIEHISQMESQLNDLKLENDEMYTKIMSSVDLEEIKRIAIQELGMKYAKEGQVIQYSGEGSDYVRQYGEIPD